MLTFELIVEPYLSGVRIDTFLSRHFRNFTSWRLHRMVTAGQVYIDDLRADADHRVRRGQRVQIRLVEPPDKLLAAEARAIPIVYEDPWLLIVDKPAGLITHPVGEFHDGSLTNALQQYLDDQTTARGLLRAGIVHRLDRMTSGLLVVPKEHVSHRMLSIDFQKGRIRKKYLTLVNGRPSFDHLTIDRPIGQRPGGTSPLMSAAVDAVKPRAARTDVRLLQTVHDVSLLECELFTGRNHQIRVHLADAGFPVVGDSYYTAGGGLRPASSADRTVRDEGRQALHAWELGFLHPVLQVPLTFRRWPSTDFWATAGVDESAIARGIDQRFRSNV